MNQTLVKKLLNSSCSPAVRRRGQELAEIGSVQLIEKAYNLTEMSVTAKVEGSELIPYEVRLYIKNGQFEKSSCTCPYDWGGICKHTAAVMYEVIRYLNDDISSNDKPRQKPSETKVQRSTKTPFKISFNIEDTDDPINLTKYLSSHKIREALDKTWLYDDISLSISDDAITVILDSDYYYDSRAEVTICMDEEMKHLFVTSTPVRRVKTLSKEEVLALTQITEYGFDELITWLIPDKRDQLLLEAAAKYGIEDLETAKRYFELSPDLYAPEPIIPKKNIPALISKNDPTPSLDFINDGLGVADIRNLKPKHSTDQRQLFFYLDENLNSSCDYNTLYPVPFIAKIKKNGDLYANSIKSFFDLSYYERFELSAEQQKQVGITSAMIPDVFKKNTRQKLNQLNPDFSEFRLYINENFSLLSRFWQTGIDNSLQLYLLNDLRSYQIKPQHLNGPYTLRNDMVFELVLKKDKDLLYKLEPSVALNGKKYSLSSRAVSIIHPLALMVDNHLCLVNSVREAIMILAYSDDEMPFAAMAPMLPDLLQRIVVPLSRYFKVNLKALPKTITRKKINSGIIQKAVYLKEYERMISLTPVVEYDKTTLYLLDQGSCLQLNDTQLTEVVRDTTEEEGFLQFLLQSHSSFKEHLTQEYFGLTHEEFIDNYWFLDFAEQCKNHQIEVFGFNDFQKIQYAPYRTKVVTSGSSGIDWFDLKVSVTVGDEQVSLHAVRKAILSKQKYLKLGNGKLALLPEEWLQRLSDYFRVGKVSKDKVQISKHSFNVLEEVFEQLDDQTLLREVQQKKKKLREFEKVQEVPLPAVQAELRNYQVKGYEWLHFLHEFGWGGILADDMGLGKTLQAITFLKSMTDRGLNRHLVVVPTSLLFNWQNEIQKFCPSLNYLIYHGSDRERDPEVWQQTNILLTSYGILVSDFEAFKDQTFDYLILDESQAIKNPLSKRFKAAVSVKAKYKLAMTGTPIENNTFDLYAQMTFANPGMFVSVEHFRNNYANAIDKDGNEEAAAQLNQLISPFILRRTKELVAKELPSKTESVIYCEMPKEQRKVYDAYRNEYRNKIQGLINDQGVEKSQMHILQALTKLRQVCDSPALLDDGENYGNESAKITELISHIREKTGNHKLLIFSQFVSMLKLIREKLEQEEIAYTYLDGQTTQKQRKKTVTDFQENPDIRVFLISLKAGGTGLNLTAADYVYIVDPWWNPAVENQAIDRCYRIGQDKKVIAYRMICKDSLEEKIMEYKAKKESVADALVTTDESIMKQLNKEDMMSLFD